MEKDNKMRAALIQEILETYTDENHWLSTNQIMEHLEKDYNMSVYRTTVGRDIAALQEMGVDVQFVRSTQNKYFIGTRHFDLAELKLLIDAIISSKCISERKSLALIKKLDKFASIYQRKDMKRNVRAEERVKPANEYSFYISDVINSAINKEKKISFNYFDFDAQKEKYLKNGGKPYIFSPYCLIWNGDYYYTVGYSDKHKKIATFRVDRIENVPKILDEDAVSMPADFNIADYTKKVFNMYDSDERVTVNLRCDNDMMKVIIDRFGEDIHTKIIDSDHFMVIAEIAPSPSFYGWVFGFGGKIKIAEPKSIKDEYIKMAKSVLA